MKQAIADLFSSKKFLTMIIGLIVAAGAKFGLALDPELVAAILGLFAILIGAQGVQDHGKEAANVNAAVAREVAKAANVPLGPQAGFVRPGLMMLGALVGLALFACGGSARQKVLATAFASAHASELAVDAYEHETAEAIIHRPGITIEQGKAELVALREKTDHVHLVVKGVFELVAAAFLVNDDISVANALAAYKAAADMVGALKGAK